MKRLSIALFLSLAFFALCYNGSHSDAQSVVRRPIANTATPTPTCPTQSVLDDGNRANEGPPPSASWTTGIQGAFDSTGIKVVSNQFVANTNALAGAIWNTSYNADQSAFVQITNSGGPTELSLWLRVANAGASNVTGYRLRYDGNAGELTGLRYDDDTGPGMMTGSAISWTASSGDYLGGTMIGSTLHVCWSTDHATWTHLGTFTDATYNNSGKIGLQLNGNSFTETDNFGGGNQ